MYRAIKLGHSDDKEKQRRIVTIKIEDVSIPHEFVKDFSFRLTDSADVIKKTVTNYLDEINAEAEVIPDNTSDFTVTPPIEVLPTKAELDRQEWERDVSKLKKAQELINCGVVFTAGQINALATLRTKIATNFKNEYLG